MNDLNGYQKKFLEGNLYNMISSLYLIEKECSENILNYLKNNPYEVPEDYIEENKNFIYGDKSDLE